MAVVDRSEVEEAFRRHWRIGSVEEDWAAWPDCLTEDVEYVEHFYGDLRGREQVRAWILALMAQRTEVKAVLEWYQIEGQRLVLNMTNRYYNPDPAGPHLSFPGLTVLEYGGNGLFRRQEDYWSLRLAKDAHAAYTAALTRWGGPNLGDGRLERLEAQRRAENEAVFARHGSALSTDAIIGTC